MTVAVDAIMTAMPWSDDPMRSESLAFKVVVAGPVGVGKTTFINTISEVRTVSTEAPISDGSELGAQLPATAGIAFGQVSVRAALELSLFATPGQERSRPSRSDT